MFRCPSSLPPAPSRKEEAVRDLESASPLVISIALGQPIPLPRCPPHQQPLHRGRWGGPPTSPLPLCPGPALPCTGAQGGLAAPSGTPRRFLERQAFDIPGSHHKLNPSQKGAIREALRKQFTVIQGPPGGPCWGSCGHPGGQASAHPLSAHRHGKDGGGPPPRVLVSQVKRGAGAGLWQPWGGDAPGGPLHPVLRPLQQVGGCPGRCAMSSPEGCAWGCWARGQSLTPRLPPGLLLSRRAELKPLRVYSEQAEATEFPAPGVGSRGPPKNTPREGRPNQTLRCGLSTVCLGGGEGPSGPASGQHRASWPCPHRSITLHHRIRQPSNPYASDLKAFDARLQKGEVFSKEDLLR